MQRSIEDRKIPPKEEMVEIAGPMEKHVKEMIKRYWAHTTKAHEEAAAAVNL